MPPLQKNCMSLLENSVQSYSAFLDKKVFISTCGYTMCTVNIQPSQLFADNGSPHDNKLVSKEKD
jgi:hypothetical protein